MLYLTPGLLLQRLPVRPYTTPSISWACRPGATTARDATRRARRRLTLVSPARACAHHWPIIVAADSTSVRLNGTVARQC